MRAQADALVVMGLAVFCIIFGALLAGLGSQYAHDLTFLGALIIFAGIALLATALGASS